MPTFGSLFAGIGGIDLGLERAGWECRFQVEWDEWCQRVLAKHWPDVPRYGDITRVDWGTVERVDLLAGGFPCQPVSAAGQQRAQEDERWLWPEFCRAIRDLRPGLALMENVTNLLAVNDGSAFGDVLRDLAEIGYDAAWDCIPAAAVGALHERDRVFIVAYPEGDGLPVGWPWYEGRDAAPTGVFAVRSQSRGGGPDLSSMADRAGERRGTRRARRPDPGGSREPERALSAVADAERAGLQGRTRSGRNGAWRSPSESPRSREVPDAVSGRRVGRSPDPEWEPQRRAPVGEAGTDGRWSDYWLTEPDVGRVAHGVPSRVDRLRGLGNAVVPQVAEVIGRRLLEVMQP